MFQNGLGLKHYENSLKHYGNILKELTLTVYGLIFGRANIIGRIFACGIWGVGGLIFFCWGGGGAYYRNFTVGCINCQLSLVRLVGPKLRVEKSQDVESVK